MSNIVSNKSHWEKRGSRTFYYKGVEYYTITPIPFYIKRRSTLLNLVKPYFNKPDIRHVCDFGCGDGWYLNYFSNLLENNIKWTGVDISSSMIERAAKINHDCNCRFICSGEGIDTENNFDLIYSFAVLAHIIDNDKLEKILESVSKHLNSSGRYVIFEQVAPYNYKGNNFNRRTIQEYIKLGDSAGLKTEKIILLSFTAHRFFERYIAKFWYKHLSEGVNECDRRLNANRSFIFRLMSSFFLNFSFNPIRENAESGWGNVLLIFNKSNNA